MQGPLAVAVLLVGCVLTGAKAAVAAAVTFDAASSTTADAASFSWSHTVGTGLHRLLIVGVSVAEKDASTTAVSYGGTALTLIDEQRGGGSDGHLSLWRLLAPPSGTATVQVTLSKSRKAVAGAVSFCHLDQTTPLGTPAKTSGNSAVPSVSLASAADELVVGALVTNGDVSTATAGAGQTDRWNTKSGTGGAGVLGAASTQAGSSSTTVSWTLDRTSDWGLIAVALRPPRAADVVASATSQVETDPVNGATNPKRIPGAAVLYTVTTTNQGPGQPDGDTLVVTEPVPANTALFVGDLDGAGSGPVRFTDGAPSSGLTYSFSSLGSTTDDAGFSNDGGSTYAYTPVPDADSYDGAVTHLRVTPRGTMTNTPCVADDRSFQLQFRVRVE